MWDPALLKIVQGFYPDVQAMVLFGTFGTEYETPQSDVDLALLLPPASAKIQGPMALSKCQFRLEEHFRRSIDLINLRQANTAFQFEILSTGTVLYGMESESFQVFEMLTLSLYQKLEEERAPILRQILQDRRILSREA